MKIIIDTREQDPWSFSESVETEVATLITGDYSLEGFTDRVAIERKNMDDFVSSIMQGRTRFMKEVERMQSFDFAAVIVEADLIELLTGKYRSHAKPISVASTAAAIQVDWGIPVIFAGNRAAASTYAERLLCRAYSRFRKK